MKLVKILTVILVALVATACTPPVNRGKVGGILPPDTNLKEVVLEVSTIT